VSRVKKWSDEFAVGRVFELRSTAANREAPCVLITRESRYSQHSGCQIDERGARHNWWPVQNYRALSGLQTARPVSVWNFSPEMMKGGRVVRRREDLERFDETDLAMIQYGHDLDFNRRIGGSPYMVLLSLIPGAIWTIFTAENWYNHIPHWEEMRLAETALHGAYYRHAFGDQRREAWATMQTDPGRLDEFEGRYRSIVGKVTRSAVEIVERIDEIGRTHIFGIGETGPVIRSGGRSVRDPRNPAASYWTTQ